VWIYLATWIRPIYVVSMAILCLPLRVHIFTHEHMPHSQLLHSSNRWQETALHVAATAGSALAVQALLDAGASMDATDAWHRTAAQVAAEQGELSVKQVGFNPPYAFRHQAPLPPPPPSPVKTSTRICLLLH